jgi:hypothetical protein
MSARRIQKATVVSQAAVWTAFGAAVAIILGAFLPWASVLVFSVNGTSGDGRITLVAGAVALVGVLVYLRTNVEKMVSKILVKVGVPVALLVALGTSLYDTIHVSTIAHTQVFGTTVGASVGAGLWLTLVASIVGIVAWVYERRFANSDNGLPAAPVSS